MRIRCAVTAIAGIALLAGAGRSIASPGCGGVFPAVADAAIREDAPDMPLGGEPGLQVSIVDGREARTLLSFDLDERIPAGAAIHRALLEVAMDRATPLPYAVGFHASMERWDEATVTWLTQPRTGPLWTTIHAGLESGTVRFDLTDQVASWIAGGSRRPGLVLVPPGPMEAAFLSREGGDPPRLVVACARPAPGRPFDGLLRDPAQQADLDRLRAKSSTPPKIRFDHGAVDFADFRLRAPAAFDTDNLTRALWFLGEFRGLLRLSDPAAELELARRSADGEHLFFRQIHAGIPVFPAEIGVHFNDGEIVGLGGGYAPEITAPSQPRIGRERAVALAAGEDVGAKSHAGDVLLRYVSPGLLGGGDPNTYLAWQVTFMDAGGSQIFVDAMSGAVVHTRPLARDAYDLSLNTGQTFPSMGGGWNICWWPTGADIEWFNENGQRPNTTPDQEGIDAFASIRTIYDYWRNTVGRDSWDGRGAQIALYVHVNLAGNAWWVGGCNIFEFDDGLATLDILGHEFTHGVTAHEAGLEYRNQSGALNESYSDLFGVLVDSANWTIGEGSTLPAQLVRTINDPPAGCGPPPGACDPDHMFAAVSGDGVGMTPACTTCNDGNDFGGVHNNSGIPNKAGSLIMAGGLHNGYSIRGLGRARAARLFHNVLANRLTSSSQFMNARNHSVAEANINFSPQERCDVQNAYASVGIGSGDADCDGIDDIFEADDDGDGIPDGTDNCPQVPNPGQTNTDTDTLGDACDPDLDNDTILNGSDNCPLVWNQPQTDTDGDGIGDNCDDGDLDGVIDMLDNCPFDPNPGREDFDQDSVGDVCDDDDDGDGAPDAGDNCVNLYNPTQSDTDGDRHGDACDNCPNDAGVFTEDWLDPDRDGLGNVCDPDDDGDGVLDQDDNCPTKYNPGQADFDFDGDGLVCDGFELNRIYEDISFWDNPRHVKWMPDLPIEIPVRICPGCPGPLLPNAFTTLIDIQMATEFSVRLVGADGLGVDSIAGPAAFHRVRLDPAPFGISRFDFSGILASKGGLSAAGAFPEVVAPDQTRYALELHPSPDTDIGVFWEISIRYHECYDADGDGAYDALDPACESLGPADCDDADPARAPGRAEVCDDRDNDCDGVVDGIATICGAGACASAGFCTGGFDSCAPGTGGVEVCDGADNDCDGVVDDVPPPTGVTLVTALEAQGQVLLAWDPVPDATGYDVVRGDLGALWVDGGDFAAATTGCAAHEHPDAFLVETLPLPPGGAAWYAVRATNCGGPGSYGTGGPPPGTPRDPMIDASPFSCADCPHDKCVPGGPLLGSCDPCAAPVCAVDPSCCTSAWTPACVDLVRSACGSAACPGSAGSCAHGLCVEGEAQSAGCDAPPEPASCVSAVCAADPYCCGGSWDAACVAEVTTICGLGCG
jgi:Zn-dependent metalloprotease